MFFVFPDEVIQKVYKEYKIQKCFLYQNLTDTDSTSLFFAFICDIDCIINKKRRNILFEVMVQSKILKILDLWDDFWQKFNAPNKQLKKQVGLYKVENVDNANIITIAVNPKECFEKYRDKTGNGKHKGLKRDTPAINFEAYSQRICSLHEFCNNQKPQKIKQKHFQIINWNMQTVSVNKMQFAGLNDKRFYFNDGIVSLPLVHFFFFFWIKLEKKKKNVIKI